MELNKTFPTAQIWLLQQQWLLIVLLLLVPPSVVVYGDTAITGCYSSIFNFGDSITDTGNLYFISPPQRPDCLLHPYGETHFGHPNGRCSDGRIILDFVAESLGLPYVQPYLGFKNGAVTRENIEQGVNFAVSGATALGRSFFEEMGFTVDVTTNYSLRVQLDWFKELLPSLCSSSPCCREVLKSSLFIVGEIGGNDYGYPMSEMRAYGELETYIPQVISGITSAIRELIDLGAITLMVPGMFPLGCNSVCLTKFVTTDKEEYDQDDCLNWLNMFSEQHNELLQIELNRIRVLYPHTNIIYADYFNAALQLYHSPEQFGFDGNALKVCCGAGGPYNFNETAQCGDSGVTACGDPSQSVSWDGYHFTEALRLFFFPLRSRKLRKHIHMCLVFHSISLFLIGGHIHREVNTIYVQRMEWELQPNSYSS